ncbi:MAG: Short-chain dehydrogenase/reductase SDR [Candidatus Uhrbacteria bacterium GW2011_GWC2_41_11]|nr:MAG: Short-chain dehydrogenase/reductase SDR [Candidatus Uhrbacteria bacterium GW2011_GWC2_41_11]
MSKKTAIVTGAAMGYKDGGPSIGGAIALRLAKDGYNVVVVDLGEMGQKTVELIEAGGGHAVFIQADVTKTADIGRIIQTTKDMYGGLHCLVNTVARYGSGMMKNVAEISEEEWNATLEVNLNGYFKMAKYTIPLLLESGGGTIVNISSIESFVALPNFSVYSVSKAAIDALTRSIAVDFAPQIRANAVLPGFVKIANSENNRSPEELQKWHGDIALGYPMKRVCEPDEIAHVVSFLAGAESSYINGQSIVVDGGRMICDGHVF